MQFLRPSVRPGPILTHSQAKNNEEGMRLVEDLGHCFRDVHLWWLGPLYPVLRLVHPNFVAPLLQALPIPPQTRLCRGMRSIDRDLLVPLGRSLALSGCQNLFQFWVVV